MVVMKKKGCLIPVLIVVVALAVGIGVGVSQMTNNPGSTNKETVPVVFDALQYEVKDKKNICCKITSIFSHWPKR